MELEWWWGEHNDVLATLSRSSCSRELSCSATAALARFRCGGQGVSCMPCLGIGGIAGIGGSGRCLLASAPLAISGFPHNNLA